VNIVLFGPPAAGKGTQGNNLVKEFNLFKVSTGDLLRSEINKNSDLGKKINSIIQKGDFVPDEMMNNLVIKILSNKKYFNRLIFDGYPRNLNQAKTLDEMIKKSNQKISCVLSLNVDKDVIIKRILGRQICSKCGLIFNKFFNPPNANNHKCDPTFLKIRSDDNEKTIENRYENYLKETLPILNFYKNLNLLHEINGMHEISKIYEEIRRIIDPLDT